MMMMLGNIEEEVLCELKEDINEQGLPPGFRFHPTDEELITFYLASKVFNASSSSNINISIPQVDLNRCEPWDLPDVAKMGEREWYFFSLRDRKYPTGLRTNRATGAGYWKATGKDREVYNNNINININSNNNNNALVGMKKTLVFYKGRAPRGEKTRWVMHEYRLDGQFSFRRMCKEEWVICRIFHKIKDKKTPILYQGRQHDILGSSSYLVGPSSPSSAITTLPPLPALLEESEHPILQSQHIPLPLQKNNINNNNTFSSINGLLQLPSPIATCTHLATYYKKEGSKTNYIFHPSPSNNVQIKSHQVSLCTLEEKEDPTPTTTIIPIQCKTEQNHPNFSHPHNNANLRWGYCNDQHNDFGGLDFTANALGFSQLGPNTNTHSFGTCFDFNTTRAFGSSSSSAAAIGESWALGYLNTLPN